jgi:hypothetical protein
VEKVKSVGENPAYGASQDSRLPQGKLLAHLCKQAAMDTRSFIGRSWPRLEYPNVHMWRPRRQRRGRFEEGR